ncbi:MAG: methionine--tRNA ligase [Gemmatimonadales bacterium]
MAKFYLNTAIDYSNGDPHLGHALEKVGADCIARYRRLRGDTVHFVMGMDEHGQKVAQAAAENGAEPSEWVTRIAERFDATWRRLHCSHDDWIRTTEARHRTAVASLLLRIRERNPNDVFLGEYEGLYCVGCEEFKQGSQIVDGRCVEHPTLELAPTRERNHFFRLSAYRDRLLELITSGRFRVEPTIRRHEIVRLLQDGLQDISISRIRIPWGIPFPEAPDHTVYVWFDALINYLSATGFPDSGYQRLWPTDLNVVGKGITRFHCVIWPAMLLAADLPLPAMVWAHGYVQWGGTKVSKTAGASVSLDEAIDRHGADALRYFLLREVGFEGDGNFTWERFDDRYTAELADGLGNLASRSLAMIGKYRDGLVPHGEASTPLDSAGAEVMTAYARAMDALDLKSGAETAWRLVSAANQYIVRTAPWALDKEGKTAELDRALAALARCLFRLALLVSPFLPAKAQALWESLGQDGVPDATGYAGAQAPELHGKTVRKPQNLFPKVGSPA